MNRLLFALTLGIICTQAATAGAPVNSLSNGKTGTIAFESIPTISMNQFLAGTAGKKPTVISGLLNLPNNVEKPVPAVVILHGQGGVHRNEKDWASRLRRIGIATFIVNSNKRPDCRNGTCYDSHQGMVNIVDAYRALALLSTHPLIDPSRIAVMGFSVGGKASLYSSVNRFQQLWNTSGTEFAAYLSFYPACNIRFEKDMEISDNPIRIFHGVLDEWVSPLACKEYIDLLSAAGNDVEITVYDNAHHGFDSSPEQGTPSVVSGHFHVNCRFTEDREIGKIVQEGYTRKDETNYVMSALDKKFSAAIKKFIKAKGGGGDHATQFGKCVVDQVYSLNDDTKSAVIQHGVKKAFGKLSVKNAMALDQVFSTCTKGGGEQSGGWFLMHDTSCMTSKARIKYNKVAAKQSIQAVTEFFAETFSIDLSNLSSATSSTQSSGSKESSTGRDN